MKKLALGFTLLFFLVLFGICYFGYQYFTSPVDKNAKPIEFIVEEGDTFTSIAEDLKEKKLIKNVFFYKIYLKIKKPSSIKIGTYEVSGKMSLDQLIEKLSSTDIKDESISITFPEGKNMRFIAKTIAENTNNTEDDVYNILKDDVYLNSLIQNYWFIDESIKNKEIYYSLEGYLYPDTYQFKNKEVDVQTIFNTMLDNMEKKLRAYQSVIEESKYSFHEILTLASMVELEASTTEDRRGVAGVFYNRLNSRMSLGSDVTTYYAAKVDMGERDLYKSELNDANAYNTRSSSLAGKLPVGPICNPEITSIEAALYPTESNYYYFVADKNKKVYFSRNSKEHNETIAELKSEGLWYTYDN